VAASGSAVQTHRNLFEDLLDLFRSCRLRQVVVKSGIGGAPSILGLTPSRQGDDFTLAAAVKRLRSAACQPGPRSAAA